MERHPLKSTHVEGARRAPKIAVVIPAHNEAAVIRGTLEAILAQEYPDFEVIVVDNASTDGTAEVVRGFPVRLVHEPQKGLLHARERGRREACLSGADVVANIDADCLPEKTWLNVAAQNFMGFDDGDNGGTPMNTEVAAVSGPYDYYDAHPAFRTASMLMQNYLYRPMAWILQLPFVRGGAVLIGGNNLIRADVLQKMGGYNTALVFYGEDTDTAKRVAKHGRVVFSPHVKMKTSARRFKKEGTLKMTTRYLFHFFKHTFKGV